MILISISDYFQVCVEKCPTEALTIFTDSEKMKPFCTSPDTKITDPNIIHRSTEICDIQPPDITCLNDLVQKGICPAWVIPSEPVLGRCVPEGTKLADGNYTNNKSK